MKEAKKREEKQKELKEKEKRRKEQKEKERYATVFAYTGWPRIILRLMTRSQRVNICINTLHPFTLVTFVSIGS